MLAAEHALHLETLFEIVAGKDKLGGFAGRQNAAMVRPFHAAELGKVAALGKMLGDELTEKVGLDVRNKGEQEEDMLFDGKFVLLNKLY